MKYINNELVVSNRRPSVDFRPKVEVNIPKNLLRRSKSYIEVKRHAPTLKIFGQYFNGIENINGPYILVDTGASNCHLARDKNYNLPGKKVTHSI